MDQINAYDGDGHVEEWEATFSDEYLEPAYRDRRPVVIETGEFEHDYKWLIDGAQFRVGGSPSSKDGIVSTEYEKMAKWRGPHESGELTLSQPLTKCNRHAGKVFLSVLPGGAHCFGAQAQKPLRS